MKQYYLKHANLVIYNLWSILNHRINSISIKQLFWYFQYYSISKKIIFIQFPKKFIIYETILNAAYESGNMELVKYIASLSKMNINNKKVYISNFLLHLKISLIYYISNNWAYYNVLYKACKDENVEIVKYLLSLDKIDPNIKVILMFTFFITFLFLMIYHIPNHRYLIHHYLMKSAH